MSENTAIVLPVNPLHEERRREMPPRKRKAAPKLQAIHEDAAADVPPAAAPEDVQCATDAGPSSMAVDAPADAGPSGRSAEEARAAELDAALGHLAREGKQGQERGVLTTEVALFCDTKLVFGQCPACGGKRVMTPCFLPAGAVHATQWTAAASPSCGRRGTRWRRCGRTGARS